MLSEGYDLETMYDLGEWLKGLPPGATYVDKDMIVILREDGRWLRADRPATRHYSLVDMAARLLWNNTEPRDAWAML